MRSKNIIVLISALMMAGCSSAPAAKDPINTALPEETAISEVQEIPDVSEEPSAVSDYAEYIDNDLVAETGDLVNFDFTLKVQGDETGDLADEGTQMSVWLGDGTFLPELEEAMVGKKANDEFDISIVFPDDYWAEAYREKTGDFHVKVNYVYREKKLSERYETIEEAADYLIGSGIIDEKSFRENMLEGGYSEAEIDEYLESADIDWSSMLSGIIADMSNYGYARSTIENILKESYGMEIDDNIKAVLDETDWNAVAANLANSLVEEAYSKKAIMEITDSFGYDDEMKAVVEESIKDVDWKEQALNCVGYYDSEMSDEDLKAALAEEQFEDEEIAYAVENRASAIPEEESEN